jgi:Lrp/AsnC family transcriptional regulator for asnA, asnC and gidA
LQESRTSFTELAKICGISVTAVIRRYSLLKKTGIITGEHMYLNPLSVGYESIAEVGITVTDLADREKVIERLRTKRHVIILGPALGKYDIYGILLARKLNELSEIVQSIDIKPYVKNLDVLIFADLWNSPWHPENLMVKPSEQKNMIPRANRLQRKFEQVPLDDIDIRILRALMENSRVGFNEIAKKLKISTANVIKRYHFLREKNVLNLSSVTLDLSKLGYNAITDIYIKVENRSTMPEVEAQLLQTPNLTFCAKYVGGAYDMRIAVIISNLNDFFGLKERVYSTKSIQRAEFYLFGPTPPWPYDYISQYLFSA